MKLVDLLIPNAVIKYIHNFLIINSSLFYICCSNVKNVGIVRTASAGGIVTTNSIIDAYFPCLCLLLLFIVFRDCTKAKAYQ